MRKEQKDLKICLESLGKDTVYNVTKIIAEADSIGEGYCYCPDYTLDDFNNEINGIFSDEYIEAEHPYLLMAGIYVCMIFVADKEKLNAEFDYEKIVRPNVAVHFDTEEKVKELLTWADSVGLKRASRSKYVSDEGYYIPFNTETVYHFCEGYVTHIKDAPEALTVLEYEDCRLIKLDVAPITPTEYISPDHWTRAVKWCEEMELAPADSKVWALALKATSNPVTGAKAGDSVRYVGHESSRYVTKNGVYPLVSDWMPGGGVWDGGAFLLEIDGQILKVCAADFEMAQPEAESKPDLPPFEQIEWVMVEAPEWCNTEAFTGIKSISSGVKLGQKYYLESEAQEWKQCTLLPTVTALYENSKDFKVTWKLKEQPKFKVGEWVECGKNVYQFDSYCPVKHGEAQYCNVKELTGQLREDALKPINRKLHENRPLAIAVGKWLLDGNAEGNSIKVAEINGWRLRAVGYTIEGVLQFRYGRGTWQGEATLPDTFDLSQVIDLYRAELAKVAV